MTMHDLFNADVLIERDVEYVDENADPRHRLDIYRTPDASGLPVAMYFHGGGWRSGDKRLFEHLGRSLALRGLVAVTANYRLSPRVRHPAHANDCARGVAWVVENIALRGGDPHSVVLIGHSAGAHLAALLAVDPAYLVAAGVPPNAIRGVVAISGASDLTQHSETTIFTTRKDLEEAFGAEPARLLDASPLEHVRPGLPPFLVIVAAHDPPGLQLQSARFAERLRASGVEVAFETIPGRDHFSIVRRFGPSNDPTAGAVASFVHYSCR